MTKSQITYIVTNVLKDEMDAITPLSNCIYFVANKQEIRFPVGKKHHYYFDSTNELVRIMPFRIYSTDGKTPWHENYITVNTDSGKIVYEYLTDSNGDMICDYLEFASIAAFKVREM